MIFRFTRIIARMTGMYIIYGQNTGTFATFDHCNSWIGTDAIIIE